MILGYEAHGGMTWEGCLERRFGLRPKDKHSILHRVNVWTHHAYLAVTVLDDDQVSDWVETLA